MTRVDVEREVDPVGVEEVDRVGEHPGEQREQREDRAASTGVIPYVVTRLTWLAASSWSRRTRLGTDASLAGIQNRLAHSIRNDATNSHHSVPTSGIEANSTNRVRSAATIILRRSKRSANAPASGPKTTAGSSRTTRTPPRAKLAAA